jgi:hypothetical protein
MTKPRVLLADDHRMVAEGLKGLLTDEFDLVGIVEDRKYRLMELLGVETSAGLIHFAVKHGIAPKVPPSVP